MTVHAAGALGGRRDTENVSNADIDNNADIDTDTDANNVDTANTANNANSGLISTSYNSALSQDGS